MRNLGFYIGLAYFHLIFFLGFFNVFNSSILDLKTFEKFQNQILCQGWGFFTKGPRDVKTYVYVNGDNIITPYTSIKNLFGIRRHNTRLGYEVGSLLKTIRNDKWKKTATDSFPGSFYLTESKINNPKILGEIIVVNEERTPWAWAKYDGKLNFYKVYLKLNVVRPNHK
jgi:antimicrobial peptide system SdpA family protein